MKRSHFLLVFVLGALAWAAIAYGVVPVMIGQAYKGSGPSFLVRMMEHKHNYDLSHYLSKWYRSGNWVLGVWLGLGAMLFITSTRQFATRMVGAATPGSLGAIRMFVCLVLAFVASNWHLRELAALPQSQRVSMGAMDLFYKLGFAHVVHNLTLVLTLKWLCVGLLLSGAIGFGTRLVLPLAALLTLPLMGIRHSFFWFSHTGLIPFYCVCALSFFRCGDGWSLDRMIRIWRGQPVPPPDVATPHYAWGRLTLWLCICVPYLCAGLSKIVWASPYWWEATNMQYIMFANGLRPGGETFAMQLTWVPAWFFGMMGIGTLLLETGMILVPFNKYARWVLPVAMFSLHLGIWIVMNINFYDMLLMQAVFFNWAPLRDWLGRRMSARRGDVTVLFDGNCMFCRRSIRTILPMDIFRRIKPVNFRTANLPELAARQGVTFDFARLEDEMYALYRGKASGGAGAFRVISSVTPALWPLWPLLTVPGLSHLASAVYAVIARNRMLLIKCDESGACRYEPVEPVVFSPTARPLPEWRLRFVSIVPAVGVSILVCGLLAVFSQRTEFYPFTSMQMFATYHVDDAGRSTSAVDYYRAYMTFEDGTTQLANFEKMGNGLALYQPTLELAFAKNGDPKKCVDLMRRSAKYWNDRVSTPGKRVVHFETHHKVWDFNTQRNDTTNWGNTVEKVAIDIRPEKPTSVAASEQ